MYMYEENKYYLGIIMDLILSIPEFQKIAEECCPTYWLDGTKCSPSEHAENIAFMEAEHIMIFGNIRNPCVIEPDEECKKCKDCTHIPFDMI